MDGGQTILASPAETLCPQPRLGALPAADTHDSAVRRIAARAAVSRSGKVVLAATALLVIVIACLALDIGHLAVTIIFGMIAYAMIGGGDPPLCGRTETKASRAWRAYRRA